ncbi:retrovirus-related pol polyprotein from transposon TNT 1-94 [Tanacetum coccineum]
MEAEVEQNAVDKKCAEIKRKNLLIENENLLVDCLSNELLYSVLNAVNTIQKDDHSEMIKHFSNLEVDHLNLQLKYQNLKEPFRNNKSQTSQDAPKFDSFIAINKMKKQLQGKDNTIRKLKMQISHMNEKRSEADRSLDIKASDSQNIELTENVTTLQEQNERLRAENEKVKQYYKELYDSIKIMRAKTIEKTYSFSTKASGSKPRSNTKNNRILPAKSDNKKKVEDHPRNNKSNLKQENRVDSSISSKRTSVHALPVKNVLSKVKQVWKATRKLFANVGYQWKPTRKKFTLEEQCPLTRITKSKVVPLQQPEHVSTSEIVITERFSNTTQKPLTRYKCRNKKDKTISTTVETQTIDAPVVHIVLWYLDSCCSKHMTRNHSRLKNFMKKFIGTVRFGNDHFGAIMGYRDYVIGDSMISRVYYVKGLGHNLFSVGQFCDLDLEVAFRKHSCYVRDVDDAELLKDSSAPIMNDVVERCNRTLVEAARTMLIFFKALMFLWAEAVATACYTQNRSLIHTHHNKTLYELLHGKKHDLTFLHVFGALCYPTNDIEDLGKLKAKADIGIFVGYAPNRKGPKPILVTPGKISSGLIPNPVPTVPYVPPTNKDLEILFQLMFDEYFKPPSVERPVPPDPEVPVPVVSAGIADGPTFKDNHFAQADNDPFVKLFAPEPRSEESSSGDVSTAESNQDIQPHDHLRK